MTHPASPKTLLTAGWLLFGGLAGLLLVSRAATAAAQASAPRFVYASGFQGVGYYAHPGVATTPGPPSAPAPRTSAARGTSVGPGVRDW